MYSINDRNDKKKLWICNNENKKYSWTPVDGLYTISLIALLWYYVLHGVYFVSYLVQKFIVFLALNIYIHGCKYALYCLCVHITANKITLLARSVPTRSFCMNALHEEILHEGPGKSSKV